MEQNIIELNQGGDTVDVIAAVDLQRTTALFARWRRDPSFGRVCQESKTAGAFDHNTVLLTVAAVLADSGLGPELVPPSSTATPDLLLRLSARVAVGAEVKTPEPLQRRPGYTVPVSEAARVLKGTLKKSHDQLASGQACFLVVGGAYWGHELDQYATAASTVLARRSRPHLAGVVLVSTTVQYARSRGGGPWAGSWEDVDWSPAASLRWVPNPTYCRDMSITFDPAMTTFSIQFRPEP